jgi:nitronate monooxygenase
LMKALTIGNLVAKVPIVQGGMGVGISLSSLASAVANQGGIGVIAAAGIGMDEPDVNKNFLAANIRALKRQIRMAREKTAGILGVNIMVALSDFAELVKASVEEKIDIIFSGAGLPLDLPRFVHESAQTKLVPIVSSAKAFRVICQRWLSQFNRLPDAVVVEGPKAGGHLGFKPGQIDDPAYTLETLTKDVLHEAAVLTKEGGRPIPVIAAGGIYTGADMRRFLDMGADGVQIGTRFVPTVECDASDAFKQSYVRATKDDIGLISSPVGMPGRAIINDFLKRSMAGEKHPARCPYRCIVTCDIKTSPYCIALALHNAKKGNLGHGFAFAGENAHRTTEVSCVKDVIDALISEYHASAPENGASIETSC